MKKATINVTVRVQDNQDGGYSIYAYNSDEAMLKDHPKAEDGELSEEEKAAILNGDDEYANGYISHDTIEVFIDDDGKVTLAEPLTFHAGQ